MVPNCHLSVSPPSSELLLCSTVTGLKDLHLLAENFDHSHLRITFLYRLAVKLIARNTDRPLMAVVVILVLNELLVWRVNKTEQENKRRKPK